jgi:hypothetical protein
MGLLFVAFFLAQKQKTCSLFVSFDTTTILSAEGDLMHLVYQKKN